MTPDFVLLGVTTALTLLAVIEARTNPSRALAALCGALLALLALTAHELPASVRAGMRDAVAAPPAVGMCGQMVVRPRKEWRT